MFCSICLVFLLWQGYRVPTARAQTCYHPDGSQAGTDTPCGSTSSDQASACCDPEDTCLSNRLCLNSLLYISRGSCTDRAWQSDRCAPWCQDLSPNQGRAIVKVEDGLFCCGFFNSSSGTCLNSTRGSDAPFAVDQGSVIWNRWSGSTSPNASTTVASAATLAGTTASSVTTIASSTAVRPAASLPSSSDRVATVGAAVGAPLGLALLGFAAMVWRQRREAAGLRKDKEDWEERYVTLAIEVGHAKEWQ